MTTSQSYFIDRETARRSLTDKVAHYTRAMSDPRHFSTVDPAFIRDDAAFRLRWIDCAPDGANHQTAPLADKRGTPMGYAIDENVGACQTLRAARARRGRHPLTGLAA